MTGDDEGSGDDESFACPNCQKPVTLSDWQRIDKRASREAQRGALPLFGVSVIVTGGLASWYALTTYGGGTWTGSVTAGVIAVALLGGLMLFGLVQSVRKGMAETRLKREARLVAEAEKKRAGGR